MKPWDKVTARERDTRMFMLTNPSGYIMNINHPEILPLYNRFRAKKCIPVGGGLSEKERLAFEWYISHRFPQEYNNWVETYRYKMPTKAMEQVEKIEEIDFLKLIRDEQYKTLNDLAREENSMSFADRARAFKAKVDNELKNEG